MEKSPRGADVVRLSFSDSVSDSAKKHEYDSTARILQFRIKREVLDLSNVPDENPIIEPAAPTEADIIELPHQRINDSKLCDDVAPVSPIRIPEKMYEQDSENDRKYSQYNLFQTRLSREQQDTLHAVTDHYIDFKNNKSVEVCNYALWYAENLVLNGETIENAAAIIDEFLSSVAAIQRQA